MMDSLHFSYLHLYKAAFAGSFSHFLAMQFQFETSVLQLHACNSYTATLTKENTSPLLLQSA